MSTPSASASDSATNAAPLPRPADGYAGDLTPEMAWQWVQNGRAVLVDVRTDAEREWVGWVPNAVALPWKQWPAMQVEPTAFDAGLQQFDAGRCLLMLCRSGVRSIAAAKRASAQGFEAYNVLEGFEGDCDAQGQRGHLGGWRRRGLPWRQN